MPRPDASSRLRWVRHQRHAATVACAVAVAVVIAGVSVAHDWRSGTAITGSASALSSVATASVSPGPLSDSSASGVPSAAHTGTSSPIAAVTAEPCRASNLHVSAQFGGAAAGNVSLPFSLTNAGTETCVLQGYPSRLLGWQRGRWHQLNFTQGTYFIEEDPAPSPVQIAPGAQAELIIGTEDACNGANVGDSKLYSRMLVTLPDQTSLELDEPVNAFCELDVSSFHLLAVPESGQPTATP